jgi:hypothetical protein
MSTRRNSRRAALPLGSLCGLVVCIVASAPRGQELPTEGELQLARAIAGALKSADSSTLIGLVDFDRRGAERFARGLETLAWSDLDPDAQQLAREAAARDWVGRNAALHRRATLIDVSRIADQDAGHGPVPDRRLMRATVRDTVGGKHCDIVVIATTDGRLLDLFQGEPYDPSSAPPDDASSLVPTLSGAAPSSVCWPPGVDDFERRGLYELVDRVLSLPEGRELELAVEYLHRNPRPAAAALVERLADCGDAAGRARLGAALTRITGRRGDAGESVGAWLRWQRHRGLDFAPTGIPEPMEPALGERPVAAADKDELGRWDEALRARTGRGTTDDATQPEAADPPAPATPPGPAAGPGDGDPPDTPAPDGSPSPPRPAPPPPAPAPGTGDEPGADVGAGDRERAGTPGREADSRRDREADLLFPAAADLEFHLDGKRVTGRDVEARLSAGVRKALNQWAETAARLELQVGVGDGADWVVLAHVPGGLFRQVGEWMDATWRLMDPSVPLRAGRVPGATVAVVLDAEFIRSDGWEELLVTLVEKRVMTGDTARRLGEAPGGLTLRHAPMFLQPAWDLAGNAAAGDDEFRLGNEVAHKFAQCLVTSRLGEQPRPILWGMGYVVEQQLFDSIYQFDTAGFVSTGDHFDWPVRTRQVLEKRLRSREFSLGRMVADESGVGKPEAPQMVTWATLGYLATQDVARLHALLDDLAALHAEQARHGGQGRYKGDHDKTIEVLQQHLDTIDLDELMAWLKRA